MSRTVSPSTARRYGLALVCRVWEVNRSTVYGVDPLNATDPSGLCGWDDLLGCAEDLVNGARLR
jgi:hypothetical protein